MSSRKIKLIEGEYYHIYNRGNSKQLIFNEISDYNYFQNLLFAMNTKRNIKFRDMPDDLFEKSQDNPLIAIGSYCLMPNHFHILLTQTTENGISKFMQKLSTAYAMYYNKKYERTGGLFEGRFKSRHVPNDRYLKYLFSYIHLNPLKILDPKWKEHKNFKRKKVMDFLNTYKYSSYLDYLGINRGQCRILQQKLFPKYFSDKSKMISEILSWVYNNP